MSSIITLACPARWLSALYTFIIAQNFPCSLNECLFESRRGRRWSDTSERGVATKPLCFGLQCRGHLVVEKRSLSLCLESLRGFPLMETTLFCFSLTADHISQWWARQSGVHHEKLQLREVAVDHQPCSESAVCLSQQQARHRWIWYVTTMVPRLLFWLQHRIKGYVQHDFNFGLHAVAT